jgi:hypothetical protein
MLKEGTVTKDMVLDMEKSMGVNLDQFAKLLDNPAAKRNMKDLPPEISEMTSMFKELAKIKNG